MSILALFTNYVLATFIVVSVVVFIHEMGHYVMARVYKFPVKTFSVGFGRNIFSFQDKYGTEWKCGIFPLGGYVVIDEKGKSIWQRVVVTAAGPLMNFILFFVLIAGNFIVIGQPISPKFVTGISVHSAAIHDGIKLGDELMLINSQPMPEDDDEIKKIIKDTTSPGVDITFRRSGKVMTKNIRITTMIDHDDFGNEFNRKRLGILFGSTSMKLTSVNAVNGVDTRHSVSTARQLLIGHFDKDVIVNFGEKGEAEDVLVHPQSALNQDLLNVGSRDDDKLILSDRKKIEHKATSIEKTISYTWKLFKQVWSVNTGALYQMITGKKEAKEMGSIINLGAMTGDVVNHMDNTGVYSLSRLVALFSAEVAFFNLLPFPILDGGNIVYCLYEWIFRKPPSEKFKAYLGWMAIVLLIWAALVTNVENLADLLAK